MTERDTKSGTCRFDQAMALGVAGLVVLTRLPFLSRSFGVDGDAWGVARTARVLAESGVYAHSRPPGYPVQEFVCGWMSGLGPWALNGLTIGFSGLAAAAFFLALRELDISFRRAVTAAVALAFVPVIYINSTVTLDYVWALAFICLALWRSVRGAPASSGIVLGLATGCRMSSLMLVLPLSILLWRYDRSGRRLRSVLLLMAAACLVTLFCYAPVAAVYGTGFLRFIDEPISMAQRAELVAYGVTFGTWGLLGSAALLIGIGGWLVGRKREGTMNRPVVLSSIVAIGLVIALFIRLPLEYGYLIPAVPFVILLGLHVCPPRWMHVALALVLLAPFVGQVDPSGKVHGSGPLPLDAGIKRQQYASLQAVYTEVERLSDGDLVLVTGPEITRFTAVLPERVTVVNSVSGMERSRLLREGHTVLFLFKDGPLYASGLRFEPIPDRPPKVRELNFLAASP